MPTRDQERYDKHAKQGTFHLGDRVLKRVIRSTEHSKLDTSYDGPYIIDAILSNGSYFLCTMDGEHLTLLWNVGHIKFFNK